MLERTYEYRICPTKEQQRRIGQIADTVRALYNQMLNDRTQHFLRTGSWKKLNPEPFVRQSLLMKDLEPSIITWTTGNLERSYINFFYIRKTKIDRYKPEALKRAKEDPAYQLTDIDLIGYPNAKSKSSRESWDIGPSQVMILESRVDIPGVGKVKINLHRPIPQDAKIHHYTILKKPSSHYFLLVHLQLPDPEPKQEFEKAVGIALEPGKLAQCSDGQPVIFRYQSRGMEGKIARAYAKLCRKTPGSNGYEKQRQRLATLYEKRTNQRRDSLHKTSKRIVDSADIIAMEEPGVMRKKKSLVKRNVFSTVQDEAWWTFSSFLRYKTLAAGKRFWKAPGALPIRNACSVCGIVQEGISKGPRWECPHCKAAMSFEMNAARVLELLAKQSIPEEDKK